MSLFHCLGRNKGSVQVRGTCVCFVTKPVLYGEMSTPRPAYKLEDHALSAVRDCLFYIFAATLHFGGRPSIRMSGAIPYFSCKPACRVEVQQLETDSRRETNTFIHCIICELNTIRRRRRKRKIRRWRR